MDFSLPPVGEGLIEVELVRWLVHPGDAVTRGQALLEVMSDKATMEVPAPFAGIIQSTVAEAGSKIQVGQHILAYTVAGEVAGASASNGTAAKVEPAKQVATVAASISTSASTATTIKTAEKLFVSTALPANGSPRPMAAPSVRHLARKLGIDLTKITGRGPSGRILLEDLAQSIAAKAPSTSESRSKDSGPKMDYGKAGSSVKLTGVRRIVAERMMASKRSIPHYAYIDECDVTDLVRLRSQLKEPFYANGVKLTYLSFIVAATVRALKEIPIVNSTYDEASQTVTLHDQYHIGIAVSVPNGLIVPVIRDADKRDLAGIASEIERLSEACRTNKIKPEEMHGGTFTVTSVGNIGGLISTPIINAPEVGIMGVGKVVKRPVYDDHGNLRPADMLYLSFSFDHRIVDGAVGAVFGNAVLKRLQNPATLLMSEPVRK